MAKKDLYNFADGNNTAVTCKNLSDFPRTLDKESESVVDCFRNNELIATPDQFQVIIMNKRRKNQIAHK